MSVPPSWGPVEGQEPSILYVPFGLTLHPRCSFCIKNQTKPYIQKPTSFPKAFNNNVCVCTKNILLESCFIITSIVNPSYSQLYPWIKIIRELCTWLHYLGPLQYSFYWIVLQHYAVGFHREINLTTSHLSSHGGEQTLWWKKLTQCCLSGSDKFELDHLHSIPERMHHWQHWIRLTQATEANNLLIRIINWQDWKQNQKKLVFHFTC